MIFMVGLIAATVVLATVALYEIRDELRKMNTREQVKFAKK